MSNGKGRAPEVPKSQEELDEEAADRAAEEAAEREQTRQRAREQGRLFLACALGCAVVGSALAFIFMDRAFAWGVLAGSATMVLNLFLLSTMLMRLLLGERNRSIYALGLVMTFGLLFVVTGLVIRQFPESAMGFGIGLSVPVAAGLLFGVFRRVGQSD